jgi:hypothetical protein
LTRVSVIDSPAVGRPVGVGVAVTVTVGVGEAFVGVGVGDVVGSAITGGVGVGAGAGDADADADDVAEAPAAGAVVSTTSGLNGLCPAGALYTAGTAPAVCDGAAEGEPDLAPLCGCVAAERPAVLLGLDPPRKNTK